MTLRSSWTRTAAALAAAVAALAFGTLASAAWAPPGAPAGVTPFAGDRVVTLSWQSAGGVSGYTVYRGTSADSISTAVGTPTGTSFTDNSVDTGTTYFYKVVANSGAGDSPDSAVVSATPRNAICTTGNAIAVENCLPGSTDWKVPSAVDAYHGGIEGFATATSIDAGSSVDLKVNTTGGAPYHVDVYRTGYYGGTQGRLVGRITGLNGVAQPDCSQNYSTGERSCADWSTSLTLSTSSHWPSGVYVLKLVRDDTNAQNYALLVVRDDSRDAKGVFVVPTDTYQAYNNYGGRSLYTFNSDGNPTVSGTQRAVKVSFDRPYQQSVSQQHDFYPYSDVQLVGFYERQGYDISYVDSVDLSAGRGDLNGRGVVLIGAHDEYQSLEMRNALEAARDHGVNIASFGANSSFWRARYEPSSFTGESMRTLVCYKTTEGGPSDPGGVTTTWRDPLGANRPENALFGGMYVGQSTQSFPMFVTAEQGKHRFWRYTDLSTMAPGTKEQVDYNVIGWEWDARVENGQAPAGVETISSSPVSGDILQDAGQVYSPGSAIAESTIYTASSGAVVWSAGTIQWGLGLGFNALNQGEPDPIIQQGTANVLADMNLSPTTPSGVTVDATGNLHLVDGEPPVGPGGGISTTGTGVLTFDRQLDPKTVKPPTITVTGPGGTPVQVTLVYDASAKTVSLTPVVPLDGNTAYTVTVTTGVKGWNGLGLSAPATFNFTTGAGEAPTVTDRSPDVDATDVGLDTTVTATFDRHLAGASVSGATVKLASESGSVAAVVTYDASTRKVTLTPNELLDPSTTYTATLTTGVTAADGTPLASALTWSFTTVDVIQVTGRTPEPLSTGISTRAVARVTFSRSVMPSTLTSSSLQLKRPDGQAVPSAITYDATTRTATITPTTLVASTTYTVWAGTTIAGLDGAALDSTTQWTFTTALSNPAAPALTTSTPLAAALQVSPDTEVRATFDRALDPLSLSTSTMTLTGPSGAVAATVSYESGTDTAVLTPSARLLPNTTYQARLTTSVRSTLGQPLNADVVFSFTTSNCPCSTMPTLVPSITGIAVQDGRPGAGPFSRELGLKVAVDTITHLTAIRFYKSPGEGGTHVGRVWTAGGGLLASTTFTDETASGWQHQALTTPVTLRPGRVYILSYNINDYYVASRYALGTALYGGPLHTVADGLNGVFGEAAGNFPTDSWADSNYFVDAVVDDGAAPPATPQVSAVTPLDGADGIGSTPTLKATFAAPVDPATITGSTFTLHPLAGSPVSATVTYDEGSREARLVPDAPLDQGVTYEAQLTTGVHAADDTPLAANHTWRFTTADSYRPQVLSTSPAAGATAVNTATDVRATFSLPLDPSTVNTTNVKLSGPDGDVAATVSYVSETDTAVLTPSAPLAPSTTYTATFTTSIAAGSGTPLPSTVTWQFTTSNCPCRLFGAGDGPDRTRPVQDGRDGPGPWSYEMGVRIRVSQPATLTAIRLFKSDGEDGTHIGRVWTSTGTPLASVTFADETATGWQQQDLSTPIQLVPGQEYVVSTNINSVYSVTTSGLESSRVSGPLSSVADGTNGVYGQSAGIFPTEFWSASNYWIDAVVR